MVDRMNKFVATELGLPVDFVYALREEDDWSFVVKCHALLETLVTQLLLEHLKQPRLNRLISRKSINEKRQLLAAITPDYLHANEQRALQALGELRNSFVHNIARTQFTLKAEFSGQEQRLKRDFGWVFVDQTYIERFDPKMIVWVSSITVAAVLHAGIAGQRQHSQSDFKANLLQLASTKDDACA
jgi:hypothetical protein